MSIILRPLKFDSKHGQMPHDIFTRTNQTMYTHAQLLPIMGC